MTVPGATKKQSGITKIEREDAVIAEALSILAGRIKKTDLMASSPNAIKTCLICSFGQSEQEVFSILWLDVRNRLIEHEILFYGTLTHCAVYPREIVKSGLRVNAAASVLVHNTRDEGSRKSLGDFKASHKKFFGIDATYNDAAYAYGAYFRVCRNDTKSRRWRRFKNKFRRRKSLYLRLDPKVYNCFVDFDIKNRDT